MLGYRRETALLQCGVEHRLDTCSLHMPHYSFTHTDLLQHFADVTLLIGVPNIFQDMGERQI